MAARRFVAELAYHSIEWHLQLIVSPLRQVCLSLYADHRDRFEIAPGSSANHQAWPGGYADHVCEVLNYAYPLYGLQQALGRPMPFDLSDALLVLFLHDLEKPFRLAHTPEGLIQNDPTLSSKQASKEFREDLIARYGLTLTHTQANALQYVEGEGSDYSRTHRAMNELAAFCHQADVWSARQCHAYPKAVGDEWVGATRSRS